MKIKSSKRGLTFSLPEGELPIGAKYRYLIKKEEREILIVLDDDGTNTVSKKRVGSHIKPLFDIRSKEVKELVSQADYLEVCVEGEVIVVKTYAKISKKSKFKILRNNINNIIDIADIIGEQTGEIVLDTAVGCGSDFSVNGTADTESRIKRVYDVISLFSGAGLLDYAFIKDSRVRMVYGLDFDEDACATYRANIGKHIVCTDIRDVRVGDVSNADIIIGGPCCQGYSNANRCDIYKQSAFEKRLLIDDYVRFVKGKKPSVFVIENVPQFLTMDAGMYLRKVIDSLPNYHITTAVVNDAELGGYTQRRRAIVIGCLFGSIELPKKKILSVQTVRDALKGVDTSWYNYNDVTMPKESSLECMKYIPQGGNWRNVPKEIHTFGSGTHSNVYRRLNWNESAPTLTNFRKCMLLHPEEDRILNVSEAAALMGLDKGFKVMGRTLNSKQQQVCNGVTQAVAHWVKETVLSFLDQFSNVTFGWS